MDKLISYLVPKISAIENTAGNTFSMGQVNFTTAFNILREVVPFLKSIHMLLLFFV